MTAVARIFLSTLCASACSSTIEHEPAGLLLPGPVAFGCFGWSPSSRIAACVTGNTGFVLTPQIHLELVGSSKQIPVGTHLDASSAAALDATLARNEISRIGEPRIQVDEATPRRAGKAVFFLSRGARRPRPTVYDMVGYTLTTACGGDEVTIFRDTHTGTITVSLIGFGDDVLIEKTMQVAPQVTSFEAVVFDTASCTDRTRARPRA
jgi:hypothetical protein